MDRKGRYVCRYCDERFREVASYRAHLTQGDHRPFQRGCCVCSAEFQRAGDMRRHIQRYHGYSYPGDLPPPETREALKTVGWPNREQRPDRIRWSTESAQRRPEIPHGPVPSRTPGIPIGRGRGIRIREEARQTATARYLPPPIPDPREPEGGGYRLLPDQDAFKDAVEEQPTQSTTESRTVGTQTEGGINTDKSASSVWRCAIQ